MKTKGPKKDWTICKHCGQHIREALWNPGIYVGNDNTLFCLLSSRATSYHEPIDKLFEWARQANV